MYDDTIREEALVQLGRGKTPEEIAKALGVDIGTLRDWAVLRAAKLQIHDKNNTQKYKGFTVNRLNNWKHKKGMTIPEEIRKEIAAVIYAEGLSKSEAARRFEMSHTAITSIMNEYPREVNGYEGSASLDNIDLTLAIPANPVTKPDGNVAKIEALQAEVKALKTILGEMLVAERLKQLGL